MKKFQLLVFVLVVTELIAIKIIPVKDPNNITISFGSCFGIRHRGNKSSEIMHRIVDSKPDLWVWLGDNGYVDRRVAPMYFVYAGEEAVKKEFDTLKSLPEYVALRNSMPVVGTWDDHDYGINNGDKTFEHKDIVRELWLDFMDEPKDSLRRTNPGGIFESYYIGDSSKVKLILLDARYSKDPPKIGIDILGEIQWKWFEEELATNTAEYVIIGSGTQYLPADRVFPEVWYEKSLSRLLELLKKYPKNRVLLLSGDVHFAEILKYPCKERLGFNLYEITSSGMTHNAKDHFPLLSNMIQTVYCNTYNEPEDRVLALNFGLLHFKFGDTGHIKVEIQDDKGATRLEKSITRSEIEYNSQLINNKTICILDSPIWVRLWRRARELFWNREPYYFILIGLILLILLIIFLPIWGLWKLLKFIFDRKQRKTKVE